MKSNKALIGYSGFVGSNLKECDFTHLYNSKNIKRIAGKKFSLVVCSAPSAEKWKINQEPEKDLENIKSLLEILSNVKCDRFVLVSTIDVLTDKSKVSYGGNRLFFEKEVQKMFKNVTIFRLPGLFGAGLKKNIIFDLKNKVTDFVKLDSSFQWIDIKRVVELFSSKNFPDGICELYPEPIKTSDLVKTFFPDQFDKCSHHSGAHYDFKPKGGYFLKKKQVLKDLGEYLAS
tara:strand:+ start:482 stop:1174 length:693 start_codon:yes stop_codon:yes gene_type:complete